MATDTATPKESVDATDNLDGWLDKRDAERASKKASAVEAEPPASPAEPTVAQPDPTKPSWRDVEIGEDVDHGFFRGKKVPQVIESYRHAETAKQKAEQRAADLARQLDTLQRQREAEEAARRVYQQQTAPQKPDADTEIERIWFDNPKEAAAKLREQTLAEARAIYEAEREKDRQHDAEERWREGVMNRGQAAAEAARLSLGLDEKTWKQRGKAVYLELTDQRSDFFGDGENLFRPDEIVKTYKALWGEPAKADPAPPIVVKPASEPPNPPGVKKAAAVTPDDRQASPLTQQQVEAAKRFAAIGGVDPKALIARREKRAGEKRG